MRKIIGKIYLREGREEKLYTKLECQECGAVIRERKKAKIQKILADEVECIHCNRDHKTKIFRTDGSVEKILPNRIRPYHKRHFKSHTNAYTSWSSMKQRCLNENHKSYPDYGGRGIMICARWLNSFENFYQDMGDREDGYSIDRIDSDGDYEPSNCRWACKSDQMSNRRPFTMRNVIMSEEEYEAYRMMSKLEREVYLGLLRADRDQQYRKAYHKAHYVPAEKNWWTLMGIQNNPYIYGPMPWKRTNRRCRKAEAIERGWYVPPSQRIKKKF